jgi:NADH-quinone oxidoreductase subunit L
MPSTTLAIWIVLLPLIGSALAALFALRTAYGSGRAHWPVILGVAGSLLLAWQLLGQVRAVPEEERARVFAQTHVVYDWMRADLTTGETPVPRDAGWFTVSFRIDPLTCVMLLTVLSVSLLVVIYSVGYMRDHHGHTERGYERFFAYMGLFVFSMCTLVLAGNFLLLYLGWEMVGLCSYLLIGFYYQRPAAAAAAKKAFLVNRVGDFGFGLGILAIFYLCGNLDYGFVFSDAGLARLAGWETAVALLLFCGAVGKSAQLPLHVWLPDAMEGPSPVSALIHAATMVTAGVYMVARCGAIFIGSSTAMATVAVIGALTALFAATIALTQFDMKRILAYSTISQLGYMFLGLGVWAADSAIFHLFTHAYFKALLFLGAGSVMHAMGGVIDVREFGGLARSMRITAVTFWIGGLALAGFPGLSGFFSKDEIIHAAMLQSPLLGWVALVTALLTAFYTFRMIFLAFHGPQRLPREVSHAHESGLWMTLPLVLLAVGAIFAGAAGWMGGDLNFHALLRPVLPGAAPAGEWAEHEGEAALMLISAALAVFGIGAAWFVYRRRPALAMAAAFLLRGPYELLHNKYYIDELYDAVIVSPLRRLGRFCYGLDRFGIDGLLWAITAVPRAIGFGLKGSQQGALQGYALGMAVGLLAIVIVVLSAR